MREEGQDLAVQIFGNKALVNNFDMSNVIKYNQYCRISGQIEKKNDKVQELFNANFFNGMISLLGPCIFFMTLKHADSTHMWSRVFAGIKFLQFWVKMVFIYLLKKKCLNPVKLVIDRDELTANILLQFFDNLLELCAVTLMIYLKILIKEVEGEHIEESGTLTSADERTNVWWTVALVSTICTLIYGVHLSV